MGVKISNLPKLSSSPIGFGTDNLPNLNNTEVTAIVQGLTTFQCPVSAFGGVIYSPTLSSFFIRKYDYPTNDQKMPPGVGSIDLQYLGSNASQSVLGKYSNILGGGYNSVRGDFTTIAGGSANLVSLSCTGGAVVGGTNNSVLCAYSVIGGGTTNTINAQYGFIGGGISNYIQSGHDNSITLGSNLSSVAANTTHTNNLWVSGDSNILGNLTVYRNLSVLGAMTYLDTVVSVTSALSVINHGGGPALSIEQYGAAPIAHFIDANGADIIFADNGYVGLGTYNPSVKLQVIGSLSGYGDLTYIGEGKIGLNQTASGTYSSTTGGANNTSSGDYSHIGGGMNNQSTGLYAIIGGGIGNIASGNNSVIVGGDTNQSTGVLSFVGGGGINTSGGLYSFVGGGLNNTSSGLLTYVGAGSSNNATGVQSSIVGGVNNTATAFNSFILGSGITANTSNFTYVNNITSQGDIRGVTGLLTDVNVSNNIQTNTISVTGQAVVSNTQTATLTATSFVLFTGLPTLSTGLPAGALWNDAGILKIV